MRAMLATRPGVFITICGAITAVGMAAFAFMAFLHNPSPLERQRLVGVETAGIGQTARLYLTREVCVTRAAEAEVFRIFVRLPDPERPTPEMNEVPVIRTDFQKGCQTRTRRLEPPDDLPAGDYALRAGFRWCSFFANCKTDWFEPIPLRLQAMAGGHRFTVRRE